MPERRVLLMYVHERSGHHQAALAIQKAIENLDPRADCRLVDFVRVVHPILEKFFQRAYLQLVKKNPKIWEFLYDNPRVFRGTKKLRGLIQRSHSKKLEALFRDFEPTDIVCTQAFPCAVIAEFKKAQTFKAVHYAVLTDFFPHSYWPTRGVDRYFVPCREARDKLLAEGVSREQIAVSGIPVDVSVPDGDEVTNAVPQILLMGGSQGFGALEEIVSCLDQLKEEFEIVVLTGLNKKLFKKLDDKKKTLKKKMEVVFYTENSEPYFRSATIVISKPGGLTVATALAFKKPLILIEPIPGQEVMNASILLAHGAAVEASSSKEAAEQVGELLRMTDKVKNLKKNMTGLAHPESALEIARDILKGAPLR